MELIKWYNGWTQVYKSWTYFNNSVNNWYFILSIVIVQEISGKSALKNGILATQQTNHPFNMYPYTC